MKNIFAIVVLIMVSSCSALDPTRAGPYYMMWMYEGPNKDTEKNKDVDPLYLKGWQQGCHTGVGANTNAWYQRFYQFQQDSSLALNPTYYKGWKDAFNYCGRYIYQHNRVTGLF